MKFLIDTRLLFHSTGFELGKSWAKFNGDSRSNIPSILQLLKNWSKGGALDDSHEVTTRPAAFTLDTTMLHIAT